MHCLRKLNWTNTLFLLLTPLIGVIGTVTLMVQGKIQGATVLLALAFLLITGLAITSGYHRLFSHKSYQTNWFIRLLFLLAGAAAFQGSALEWATDHRNHHRYTDTDKDPYNIKRGFWFAHIGWLFFLDIKQRDFSNVADMEADVLIRLQHRFFIPIAIFMGFVLPMLLGMLWHDPWGALIMAGALRIAINHQLTFCINSVCHILGERRYPQQTGVDNWITALFTYGEGFHNFHHQFPIDYRNGIRFYHFDPSKWLIRGLAALGLASNLRTVTEEQMLRYQLQWEDNFESQASKAGLGKDQRKQLSDYLHGLRDRIMQRVSQIEQLESQYRLLKARKLESLKEKFADYRAQLEDVRSRLKQARLDLKNALQLWSRVWRHPAGISV